tara:strand:+ start:875 stop:2956 length:2082 start_codon:yes stop_codon:yes gene_type:complete
VQDGVVVSFLIRCPLVVGLVPVLVLSASVSAETKLPARKDFHLYLLVGQSNMAGRGKVAAEDKRPIPGVLSYGRDGRWIPAVDPLHFDKPTVVGVGVGRSFAREIIRARPGTTIGLVPCAVGGSPIGAWAPGGFHASTKTHPWDDCLKRIRAAMKHGTLKGILWHQGESDTTPERAKVYEKKLHELVARFRRELKAPRVPFVAGQMGRWPERPWDQAKRVVDAAHRRLPGSVPRTAFVSAKGLKHKGDKVHFDAGSYRELGRRYAVAYLKLAGTRVSSSSQMRRPNVILIMADDVGYECFGCYGSKQYKTPHIDRLAKQGLRFRHCYSQPLCTPSRVKLMTGLSNVRNYSAFSVLNRDQKTIGQYMQAGGYRTVVAGKWQLLGARHYGARFRGKGTWPEKTGFDEMCLWQVDQLGSRFWKPLLYINGTNRTFGPDDYGPDIVTRSVTDFIEANRDRPFFAYMPLIQVHNPFLPTPASASRQSKNQQRNFQDMVAYMDQQVGRVVGKVHELGLDRQTLVIFTGDNGTNRKIRSRLNGREIRGGKGQMTDAGTRVPLIVRWPERVAAGQVTDALVDFSDFLPTVLDVARVEVPGGLDGRSFAGLLAGDKTYRPRDWIHVYYCPRPERTPPKRFVRNQRFKLYGDGRFFDITADVLEKSPLADSPDDATAAAALAMLKKALASMPARGQSLLKFVP